MTRTQIAKDLLMGCPRDFKSDHEVIAAAVLRGDNVNQILTLPVLYEYPDTYRWLKEELFSLPEMS